MRAGCFERACTIRGCAYAEGIVQHDPARSLTLPKSGEVNERRAFTEQECAAIERVIATHEHGLFLATLYYLGVRRGEALGLQWRDIDWKQKCAKIRRDIDFSGKAQGVEGELKTKAAYRDVPIPDVLLELMRDKRGLAHMYLFGVEGNKPMSRTTYQRRWMMLMMEAGFAVPVEYGEHEKPKGDIRLDWKSPITAHYFRHNYATLLYNAGVDALTAMKILGHSSYSVTAKIYTHLNNTHIEIASQQINEKLSKTKVAEKLPEGVE